jgi:serine/threonine protein kinase
MNVYNAQGKSIGLGESVGRGGEATVYRVSGQAGWLAKIYEPAPRPNYAEKLAWMISHPPENPTRALAHSSLAWPSGLLYDSRNKLAGYMMPHIHAAVPMLEVFNPRRRQETLPRFDRRYLHRTARNLSATLTAIHARGYVIGDLNESNVLVTPSALVSLIDTDSFQVQEVLPGTGSTGKQVVNHPCPVGKLEYTPPELHNQVIGSVLRQPAHDAFALGVLIFQLLMEGSHPFRAQWLGGGDPPPVESRIAQGIFPYSATPDSRVRPPKGAPDLNRLHPALVELIFRCFIDGHKDWQRRPAPEQWEAALASAESALVECPDRHLYSNHLVACPYCQATGTSGKAAPAYQAGSARRGQATSPHSGAPQRSSGTPQSSSGSTRASPGTAHGSPGTPQQSAGPTRRATWPPPPRQKHPPQPQSRPRSGPHFRPSSTAPTFNWQAFIASQMKNSWTRAAYPKGAPSPFGTPSGVPYRPQPRPSYQPPSRPFPRSQPGSGFVYHPGSVKAWVSPRLSKSLFVGGGLGALVGALIGGLAGLASASSDEIAAMTLLWALGGAAAGVLRGWKPGYRMSRWVDRNIGWHRLLPILGLLVGAMVGMLLGFIIGWWAIIPVFVGMFYGARLGKKAGRKVVMMGSRIGWDRLWAGLSALVAALFGLRLAVWLSAGAMGSMVAQGAASLSGWLTGLLSGSASDLLIIAVVSGVFCGGLAGAVSGSLTDLFARLSGLVD